MPAETAEATFSSTSGEVSGLFDQAYRAMGDSFKVALKAQEDTVKFWSEAAGKVNPVRTVTGDFIPTAQKNAEEYLRLLETSYRRNADLLKKVIANQNGADGASLEKRTREWLEAYIEVARENAQDLANTNLRVVQLWSEVFKKTTQAGQQAAQTIPVAQKVPVGK